MKFVGGCTDPYLHLLKHRVVLNPGKQDPHGVRAIVQEGNSSSVQFLGQLVNVRLKLGKGCRKGEAEKSLQRTAGRWFEQVRFITAGKLNLQFSRIHILSVKARQLFLLTAAGSTTYQKIIVVGLKVVNFRKTSPDDNLILTTMMESTWMNESLHRHTNQTKSLGP